MIEAEAWGNPNGDGYDHDGDMKAATAFETLAKAYWLLGGTKEALEWRPQIVGKLEWQGKRFVELV